MIEQVAETKPLINFTANAASKVFELISLENQLELNLRVSISGGGCSGFQYGFTFDEEVNDGDHIFETSVRDAPDTTMVKLVIDPISFQYLIGSEVDYKKDLQGEQFVIRNPNANTSCGCGNSFSV